MATEEPKWTIQMCYFNSENENNIDVGDTLKYFNKMSYSMLINSIVIVW